MALLGCHRRTVRSAAELESSPSVAGLAAADNRPPGERGGGFVEERSNYETAMNRARTWLDTLRVDPLELRAHGIKGKTKLVELLDAYYRLWQIAAPDEKARLLERIRGVVSITYDDRYHDMLSISDEWFKQDSTSYLRAAVVMGRLGLDTQRYRREIMKINQRLNSQMSRRGAHQRSVFHWYYQEFALQEPFPLGSALEGGVIAQRRDPAGMSMDDVYMLTHEIYVPYEFGDRLDVDPFTEGDKAYVHAALRLLIQRYMSRNNPDLVAELLECQHLLRMQAEPSYHEATDFLLRSQNPDGSWGSYPRERQRLGDFVRQGYQLHTTLVAIDALTEVFDRPMPPHLQE